jgi:hypothetical protein
VAGGLSTRSAGPPLKLTRVQSRTPRADKAAGKLGCSRSLIYRLIADTAVDHRLPRYYLPVRGRAPFSRLLDPKLEARIHSAAERIYLQPEQPRVSDLLRAITTECHACGLKPPAFHTIQARLRELDQRRLVRRRLGATAARQNATRRLAFIAAAKVAA